MPVYQFRSEDGEELERYYKFVDAPTMGSWIEHDGVAYQRVIEAPQIANSKGQVAYRLHSEACPGLSSIEYAERRARALGTAMPVRAPKYDENGRAVFTSPDQLKDYCARDGRFAVGNPKEVAQEHVKRTVEHKSKQLAEVARNEALSKVPEVS